jgi:hypothetical protein
MGSVERMVFTCSKIVLSRKELRAGMFFYFLGMHLLIFTTSYHWIHENGGCGGVYHPSWEMHPEIQHMHHGVPLLDHIPAE